jgi:hypothetical protein
MFKPKDFAIEEKSFFQPLYGEKPTGNVLGAFFAAVICLTEGTYAL